MTGDSGGEQAMQDNFDWGRVPPDPDLSEDLGYELVEMDIIETQNGSGQLLFLPWDEEMIRDDSFIVATETTVENLIDWR